MLVTQWKFKTRAKFLLTAHLYELAKNVCYLQELAKKYGFCLVFEYSLIRIKRNGRGGGHIALDLISSQVYQKDN